MAAWMDFSSGLKAIYKDLSDREMQLTASVIKRLDKGVFMSNNGGAAAPALSESGGYDSAYVRSSIAKDTFSAKSPLHIEISK